MILKTIRFLSEMYKEKFTNNLFHKSPEFPFNCLFLYHMYIKNSTSGRVFDKFQDRQVINQGRSRLKGQAGPGPSLFGPDKGKSMYTWSLLGFKGKNA